MDPGADGIDLCRAASTQPWCRNPAIAADDDAAPDAAPEERAEWAIIRRCLVVKVDEEGGCVVERDGARRWPLPLTSRTHAFLIKHHRLEVKSRGGREIE